MAAQRQLLKTVGVKDGLLKVSVVQTHATSALSAGLDVKQISFQEQLASLAAGVETMARALAKPCGILCHRSGCLWA